MFVESLSSTQSPEFSSKYYINCYIEFKVSLGNMRLYFIYYLFACLFVFLMKTNEGKNWDNFTESKCSKLL